MPAELRASVDSLEDIEKLLLAKGARLKEAYQFEDGYYHTPDGPARIRTWTKSGRAVPGAALVCKPADIRRDFASMTEATNWMNKRWDHPPLDVSFSRTGREYVMHEDSIYLEDIEGHMMIEVESPSLERARSVLEALGVKHVHSDSTYNIMRDALKPR